MSSKTEPAIWSCDSCQRIPCFHVQLLIDQDATFGNGATLLRSILRSTGYQDMELRLRSFDAWELHYYRHAANVIQCVFF